MTYDDLLTKYIYCPQIFDLTVPTYLQLGCKVLMLLSNTPILFKFGDKNMFNPIYLQPFTDLYNLKFVSGELRYRDMSIKEYTISRSVYL